MNSIPSSDDISSYVKAYRKARRAFHDVQFFGLGVKKPDKEKMDPRHVNGRYNPCPALRLSKNKEWYVRYPLSRSVNMDRLHLLGERPYFDLARPDAEVAILTLDWDGVEGTDLASVLDRVRRAMASFFPYLHVFCEPSRSYPQKTGAYVRFAVRYGNLPGPLRKCLEHGLNRALQMAMSIWETPELKYDAVKGTTTFLYDNPNFDRQLFNQESLFATAKEFLVDGEWGDYESANSWCEETGLLLSALKTRLGPVRIGERYETNKKFYGVFQTKVNRAIKFDFDPRLEVRMRHFATLVTSPCYACFSGTRPNLFEPFHAWLSSPKAVVDWQEIFALLAPEDRIEFERTKKAVEMRTWPKLPKLQHAQSVKVDPVVEDDLEADEDGQPSTGLSARKKKGIERWKDRIVDPALTVHERYVAAGFVAFTLQSESEEAVDMGLNLVEGPLGPATGPRHGERVEHLRHCVEFAERVLTGLGSSRGYLFMSREDIPQTKAELAGHITQDVFKRVCWLPRRSPINLYVVAAVYGAFLCIYQRSSNGRINQSGIDTVLAKVGASQKSGSISAAIRVLEIAEFICMVANYSTLHRVPKKWKLTDKAVIPTWAHWAYQDHPWVKAHKA